MNYVVEKENEKGKEGKKASEAESFEGFEDEGLEGGEEGFGAEEGSASEGSVPYYGGQGGGSGGGGGGEAVVGERESCEDWKVQELRGRWRSVTGRRPGNIPNVKRYGDETEGFIPFGDRKPAEVERKQKEKWLLAARKVKTIVPNFGRVLKEVRLPTLCEGVLCVRYDRYGGSFATSYRNGGIQVREPLTGEVTQTLQTIEQKDRQPIRAVRYHPLDSELLYGVGAYGVIQAFNIRAPEVVNRSAFRISQTNSMDITPDGENLITGGRQGRICLFDPETLQIKSMKEWPALDTATQQNVEDEYHSMKIYGLRCHPTDPNLYVTGAWDATVKIWDVRTSPAVRSIRGPMVYGEGVDVMENSVVTASWRAENSLSLWDLSSGQKIKDIPIVTKTTVYEGEFLYAVRFFSDTRTSDLVNNHCIAVGGSGFSSVFVINTITEKTLASFPAYKAVMSVDVSGNLVAIGGKESVLRIGEVVLTEPKQRKVK